ncbi:MAG: hypothetical protein WCD53_09250, partial [Microcoleus sp.]
TRVHFSLQRAGDRQSVDRCLITQCEMRSGQTRSCNGDRSEQDLYRLRLHRNDLTALGAEGTESEKREMNNSDTNGFDITQ